MSSLQLYEILDLDVPLLQSLPEIGAKMRVYFLDHGPPIIHLLTHLDLFIVHIHNYNFHTISVKGNSYTLGWKVWSLKRSVQYLCVVCFVFYKKTIELTRSATLHKPSESWSKDSTVSTPGEQEQAFSSRRPVFLRASFVATSKPAGQLSSGTPNKPWKDKCRYRFRVTAGTHFVYYRTKTIYSRDTQKVKAVLK